VSAFHFQQLTPDLILDALASLGLQLESGLTVLNSYENRVYQFRADDGRRYVVKFYRPERWSEAQLREEHQLAQRLADAEIPVACPLPLQGDTLHRHRDFWFALWPSLGGRHLEPDNLDQLEAVGRQLGRWHHQVRNQPFRHRPAFDFHDWVQEPIEQLKRGCYWPTALKHDFPRMLDQLAETLHAPWHSDWQALAIHGDCHIGNILWRDGPLLVDLDDSRMGPAVQDLWLLLSGERNEQLLQLDALLCGYEEFCEFNPVELRLIEPLRCGRMLHHLAWLARRWPDPAFPRAFPWFATERFWHEQLQALRQQRDMLKQPPLSLTPGY
jgi:Ser/Thr protein kinase RdoA (MazF antagonist)